jgi:cyclomaltodextrinase / maltogenic alpha-amylase / neopullulanase
MMRIAVPVRLLLSTLFLLLTSCAVEAGDLRIVALQPETTAGEWTAVVAGAKADAFTVSADGAPVRTAALGNQGDAVRLRLSGVPATAARIEVAWRGKEQDGPVAAVRVGMREARTAPFSELTIYQIMVDMFADGNPGNDGEITGWKHPNYAGGDLQGILEHAQYLQDLGVNAVWLSPIFAARSSHGYDVTNYYRVSGAVAVPGDPQASADLFRKLVADLHRRGIQVILDLPLNHASASYQRPEGDPEDLHPRATGPKQDAEKLWDSWGAGYRYWDFGHAPTRRFLTDVALHWLRDEGVDGLRLDYVRGVPHDFWADLYGAVKAAKPGAFLVGEAWIDAQGPEANAKDIATYYAAVAGRPQFDSLLDFPLQKVMTEVFALGSPAQGLETWLQTDEAVYGPAALPTYFLDNHDMARFMAWTDKPDRLVAAVGFMASLSSPLVLFYGTETGLSHGAPKTGFTDVGRIPMPWQKLDAALIGRLRSILAVRKEHPALTRGGRVPLLADREVLVQAKVVPEETVLVGVNLGAAPRTIEIAAAGLWPAGAKPVPLLGASLPVVGDDGRLRWQLPPLSTVMLAVPRAPARPAM